MTTIDLRDEYARILYGMNPDKQPWDGDPFTFDEPRNVTTRRDLAIRQADALINSGVAPATMVDTVDWGYESRRDGGKVVFGGTTPDGTNVDRYDEDTVRYIARNSGGPVLTRVRRVFQTYLGGWTPAPDTTGND